MDFALVVSNDEFLKETSDLNNNSRYLLSGFTGTAGDMLVMQNKAYLFVDGRYHIQVDEQTDKKFITPVKLLMGETINDKTSEIIEKSNIKKPKMAIVTTKISEKSFIALEKKLQQYSVEFIFWEEDFICKFFATKTEKKVYKVWNVGISLVGKTTAQKLKGLKKYEDDFLLVFSNDEVCYLANIRSDQNPYSSSMSAFALVGAGVVRVFCDKKFISQDAQKSCDNVIFYDFSEFDDVIKKINSAIFYEPSKTPLFYINKLLKKGKTIKKISSSPIAKMKARKNKVEMAYIKECYKKSDKGIFKAISFLQDEISKNKQVTCQDFMDKLIKFEKEQGVIGLSFNTILAVNERSAIIHCTEYNPKQILKKGDLILLDFGVYFDGGYSTDMTRTFAIGKTYKNDLLKKVYTTVLKAFLNTLNYNIKADTTFYDLDKKARGIIKKANIQGFNFNHGTGHGIGLSVHEMPPVLSQSKLAQKKLCANMVFSIEPGMYKENVGGVRLENSVCTIKTSNGIKIQTLTNLPFDEKLIIFDMLNKKEQIWLKNYLEKAIR